MKNETPKNSREDVSAPSRLEQAESPLRPPALLIVAGGQGEVNRRGGETLGVALARVYRIVLEGARGQP